MDQAKNYVCESCMTPVPSGHKFCGRCGTPLPDHILNMQTPFFSDMQDPEKARIVLIRGEDIEEKVIALRHPDLLELSTRKGRPITDPWCMKIAALHLREMIQTDRDMDKILVTPVIADLERHASVLDAPEPVRR